MNGLETIRVAVSGANGRMGREVCRTVLEEPGLELVGAFDLSGQGRDAGILVGKDEAKVGLAPLNKDNLEQSKAQVLVDFSTPMAVMENIHLALDCGVRPVVGTTGITQVDLESIRKKLDQQGLGAVIAPNFALGAVLMMKFAAIASRYLPQAEVIEMHHDKKVDAPSGTALKTAEMIAAGRTEKPGAREDLFKLAGVRGGVQDDVHIHSVRLNGLIAHQMVIFGGLGQTLTIRHDSYDRTSFMPGVVLAVKHVVENPGLVYGLENLIEF